MEIKDIPVIISDNYLIDPETDFHYAFIRGMPVYPSYHRHDFFEVVLISKGMMYHLIKEEKILLHEGTLLFIRPDDYHYYEKAGYETCNFINLAFSAEIFSTLVTYLGEKIDIGFFLRPHLPPVTILTKDHMEFLHQRIDKLNTYFSKVEIKAEFRAVMADILACFLHEHFLESGEEYPPWFRRFFTLMHNKEYFTKDISYLYASVYKSREHVSRIFKHFIGETPTNYLNEIRLNYAVRHLIHSDHPILDVALESGFDNLSHFYHLFKRKYSETPAAFRKTYRRIVIPENAKAYVRQQKNEEIGGFFTNT